MASGRINRNVPTQSAGGLGGNTKYGVAIGVRHTLDRYATDQVSPNYQG